jgi:hypothetical protein
MKGFLRLLGPALLAAATAPAATLTVTNTIDSGPGSLRQAILDSNASVGVLDTITFAIPGTGPFALLLGGAAPVVTDPVVIDGTTQSGYAGTPLIQIRSGLGAGPGMILTGDGTTVRGLAFSDLTTGIQVDGNGNTIEACFIGTDPTGMLDVGNGIGILITGDGNTVGGTTAAARNVVSGNDGHGIRIFGGNNNAIRGNYIGTKVDGSEALANGAGIKIASGTGNTIGGLAAGEGNVISGNAFGVDLGGSTNTLIAGNRIGTDAAGSAVIANGSGIQLSGTETGLVIGGTTAAARNVISGNDYGIVLAGGSGGTMVLGNFIGSDATGALALGNGSGIVVNDPATSDTVIGGVGAGEANVIAFNQTGIWNLGTRTTIRGNSIHDNADLGIDVGVAGPTPNDPTDNDGVQNFPLVQTVDITLPSVGSVRVQGVLQTAPGNYTLDFYANPPCAENPTEFLEGATWLGEAPLTVGGPGLTAFDVTLPVSAAAGSRISATATDTTGRTSEFSQRLPFTITPSTGPGAGGTMVQVFGTNFEPGLTASIGGVPMTGIAYGASVFFNATTPALPGGVYDVTVTNPSGRTGTIPKGWITEFSDMPPTDPFYSFVATLVRHGITAGVGGGAYGATQPTLRQQMAVFLLKALHGICYVPPACTGMFDDVACPSTFADWIEAFAAEGITGGCGGNNYCPTAPVRRDQMAVFLLKAEHGPGYMPPPCAGVFGDVVCPSTFANWIEQLAAEHITSGCGNGNYCPGNPNTRGQMAVFIVKTFNLQ